MIGQKLLEAVFGDQAVRTLAERARAIARARAAALLAAERARFTELCSTPRPVDARGGRRLREAARHVDDLRSRAAPARDPADPEPPTQ